MSAQMHREEQGRFGDFPLMCKEQKRSLAMESDECVTQMV